MRPALVGLCLLGSSLLWAGQDDAKPEFPAVVTPGDGGAAPSDAIVLFDGTNLDGWQHPNGDPTKWKIADGVATVHGGSLITKQHFGDVQLHVEFATPLDVSADGQGRGNSGVYLQGRYEVQVLDSYENETYPDGQCGAVYGQAPPLVNACRAPGEWQTYDIVFRAAEFDAAGKRTAPAVVTVLHNGVLIQDHHEFTGATLASMQSEGAAGGPIYLQDHGNAMRYRNIWIRNLD